MHCAKYRKYHKRVHTNERPYKCGTCELTFKRPGTRANHELKHLKIKPFQCTECKYGTITKQNLRKHMAVKHPRPVLPVLPVLPLYVDVASSVLSYPDADTELESEFEPINVHLVEPLNSKAAGIDTEEIENGSNEESIVRCVATRNYKETTNVLSYPDADAIPSTSETSSKKRSIDELEPDSESINFHLVEPLNSKVARIGPKDIENYSNEESNVLFEDAFQQDYDYDQLLFSFQDDSLIEK